MKNPFSVRSNETVLMRVHKDLVTAINREQRKQQRVSDMKFGKGKFKVKKTFASKILGRLLK